MLTRGNGRTAERPGDSQEGWGRRAATPAPMLGRTPQARRPSTAADAGRAPYDAAASAMPRPSRAPTCQASAQCANQRARPSGSPVANAAAAARYSSAAR